MLNINFNPNINIINNNKKQSKQQLNNKNDDEIRELIALDEMHKIRKFSSKNISDDFTKRMKDNEDFIKNNNIILDGKYDILKKKPSSSLKLYKLKGYYLNQNNK